jgi:hypothetical protein
VFCVGGCRGLSWWSIRQGGQSCIIAGVTSRGYHILLCATVLLYGLTSAYLILHETSHRILVLLAAQYLVVLPVTIRSFRPTLDPIYAYQPPVRLAVSLSLLVVATAAVTSLYIGRGVSIPDESAYRFQAQIFASGRLSAEALPGAEISGLIPPPIHFEHHVILGSRWFAKYPPGWPALLALAARANLMPLLNPLLGGGVIALVFLIAKEFFDRMTASLSVLVLVSSPYFLANIVGTMAHASCALFVVLACYFCLSGLSSWKVRFFWLSFVCVGVACQIRPLTGLAVGTTLAVSAVYRARKECRSITKILLAISVTASVTLACSLMIQYYYTGSPLLSPYSLAAGTDHISEIDLRPLSLISSGLGHSRREWLATLIYIVPFWPALAAYGLWRETAGRTALVTISLPFVAALVFYLVQQETSAGINGCRYYFETFCPVCVVVARGTVLLLKYCRPARKTVTVLFAAFGCLQLLAYIATFPALLNRSLSSREVWKHVAGPERIVFLQGEEDGFFVPKHCNWNAPEWRHADHIFLVDPGPSGRQLWAARFGELKWRVVGYDGYRLELSVGSARGTSDAGSTVR